MSLSPAIRIPRWFSFSLRGLLLAVTILAVMAGWMAEAAHRQRKAVACVRENQGALCFDSEYNEEGLLHALRIHDALEPPGPAWLRRWIGDEFFQSVWRVSLTESVRHTMPRPLNDLQPLAGLPTVRRLVISWHRIRERQLAFLVRHAASGGAVPATDAARRRPAATVATIIAPATRLPFQQAIHCSANFNFSGG